MVQRVPLLVFALGLDGLLLLAYLAIFKNVNLFVKFMWRLRMRNSMKQLKLRGEQRTLIVVMTTIPSTKLKMKES